ncbi:serine protease ami-like isoform 2-T2 [Discoglossus pictus]
MPYYKCQAADSSVITDLTIMAASWILSAVLVVLSITHNECRPRGRILGGRESVSHFRPYLVSVQLNGTHRCGGLLISDQWVLTAAHCMPDSNDSLHVVLGAHSLTNPEPSKLEYKVRSQIAYPLYNSTTKNHDLLLLELPVKAPLSSEVKPLPYQTELIDPPGGTVCLVAGWGHIKLTGKKPDVLHEVEVPIISRATCNRRDHYDNEVTENKLCAGGNRKDSCEGDSGGPLVCNGVAEGIVSGGHRKCGNPKRPGIYTRIAVYKDWIQDTMNKAASTPKPTVDL